MQSTMLYPVLYWRHAPWARTFYKSILPEVGKISRSNLDQACYDLVLPHLLRRLGLHHVGALEQQARVGFSLELSEEHKGLLTWGEWVNKGRETLQVAPALALELAASKTGELVMRDVLDIDGESLAWYVHFNLPPNQLGLLDGKTPIEGAYILLAPGHSARIVLAGRAHGDDAKNMVPCTGRYDLRLLAASFDLPVDEAVDVALDADLRDIENAKRVSMARGYANGDVLSDRLRDRMLANRDVYKQAISYLINVLAYLKWVSHPPHLAWPDDAPQNLTSKFKDASKRQRDIVEDKLWNLGFTHVLEIGREFAPAPSGSGVSVHVRDSHWRNQAHGPAHSLRKLIWIRPSLVGNVGNVGNN